jgi:hypothetical protein
MKASELRIGNWYLSTKFKVPVMCEIGDFYEIYMRAEGSSEYDVDDIFKQIPLTEEWLVKMGFKSANDHSNYVLDEIEISWAYTVVSTNERFGFYLDGDILDSWKISLEYIHQLQNLYFALTRKELIIKS